MNYIFRIVALSLALITCWGCDKDDDSSQESVSTGKDNYIVSFAITVDGISYNASITDDRILVKVPYDISLKGAAASYTLSENATINPDPSALTAWNEEWQFIVTSGNKGNKASCWKPRPMSIISRAEGLTVLQEIWLSARIRGRI